MYQLSNMSLGFVCVRPDAPHVLGSKSRKMAAKLARRAVLLELEYRMQRLLDDHDTSTSWQIQVHPQSLRARA